MAVDRKILNINAQNSDYFLELKELRKLIDASLYSLIILSAIGLLLAVLSHSMVILVEVIDDFLSIMLHLFNFIAVRSIIRQNIFRFPLGAGKLENLSGFFTGALISLMTFYVVYTAVSRVMHPPAAINFGLAQISLVLSLGRTSWILIWVSRIRKRYQNCSPMTQSYYLSMKVSSLRLLFVLCGLIFGSLIKMAGYGTLAFAVDLALSMIIFLYMLSGGISMVRCNFPSLIDLPLPENDQLNILKALIEDYDSFKNIGNIYSHLSGGQRIIQIELYFDDTVTVRELDELRGRIERRLSDNFNRVAFHLIPRRS